MAASVAMEAQVPRAQHAVRARINVNADVFRIARLLECAPVQSKEREMVRLSRRNSPCCLLVDDKMPQTVLTFTIRQCRSMIIL